MQLMGSFLLRWRLPRMVLGLVIPICSVVLVSVAQDSSSQASHCEKKTYVEQNGTQTLLRTLETEHRFTSDGEVEIQRYRAPAWDGDDRVSWEREVRTRKLPDGPVEKEYVLRNPDGSGKMVPIQVIHERMTQDADSTIVQREGLDRLGGTDLQPVLREQITEKESQGGKQIVREVHRLNTASHEWQTVDRETSSITTSTVGETKQVKTEAVIQSPDAWGNLTDYERRHESTKSSSGVEIKHATVYRRNAWTTDNDHFFLLDDSTTETKTDGLGTTSRYVVRKSDLLYGNQEQNSHSRDPEVVEVRLTVEKSAPDGSKQTVTKVKGRTSAEPSAIRPVYTLEEWFDAAGYVRRIYIPEQ